MSKSTITNTQLSAALRGVGVIPNGRRWSQAREMVKAGVTDLDQIAATVVQAAQPEEMLKPKSLGCSDLSCEHGRCAALRNWGAKKGITTPAPKAKAVKGAKKAKASKKAAPVQAPVESEAASLVRKLEDRPEVVELLRNLLA